MVSYKSQIIHNSKRIKVLILIVVEDGLVPIHLTGEVEIVVVLILIVVEDGLVHPMRGIAASKAVVS